MKELESVARTLLTTLCGGIALGIGIAGAVVIAVVGLAAIVLMVLYGLLVPRKLPPD